MKRENENENENEEYYVLLLVLFVENIKLALELFGAAAGLERSDSRYGGGYRFNVYFDRKEMDEKTKTEERKR